MLIRGLPGSGKSTLAKFLQGGALNTTHLEVDQYFTDADGKYEYDGMKIGEAHRWCQEQTYDALKAGLDVIVSNTFTTLNEIRPYFDINRITGTPKLNIILCQGNFGSIRGIPDKVFENMKTRFVYDLTPLWTEYEY